MQESGDRRPHIEFPEGALVKYSLNSRRGEPVFRGVVKKVRGSEREVYTSQGVPIVVGAEELLSDE